MQRLLGVIVATVVGAVCAWSGPAWAQDGGRERGASTDAVAPVAGQDGRGAGEPDAAPAAATVADPVREATLDIVDAIEETAFGAWLRDHPAAWNAIAIATLFTIGLLLNLAIRRALGAVVARALERAHRKSLADSIRNTKLIAAIAAVPPLLLAARLIDVLGESGVLNLLVAHNVANLTYAVAIVFAMMAASRMLAVADELYSSRPEVNRPGALRGYRQVGMVVIALAGGFSAAAIAVGKSPLVFLAALGAVGAVLGVVFKDLLFSLVANLVVTANDAIRVGDWIEMKQHGIDGRIAEIKTISVRVQNADGTVQTVPISRFVQEPWLNYRSKYGSPGRRVRRSFRVDLRTVRALDGDELDRLSASGPLRGVAARAAKAAGDAPITNLCVLRAHVERLLATHHAIDTTLPIMVTQQEAGTNGVPVDVVAFIRADAGSDLASIEGAILDRVALAAPAFGLRLYQSLGDIPPAAAPAAFLGEQELRAAGIA